MFATRSGGAGAPFLALLAAAVTSLAAGGASAQATVNPYSPRLEIVEQEVGWRVVHVAEICDEQNPSLCASGSFDISSLTEAPGLVSEFDFVRDNPTEFLLDSVSGEIVEYETARHRVSRTDSSVVSPGPELDIILSTEIDLFQTTQLLSPLSNRTTDTRYTEVFRVDRPSTLSITGTLVVEGKARAEDGWELSASVWLVGGASGEEVSFFSSASPGGTIATLEFQQTRVIDQVINLVPDTDYWIQLASRTLRAGDLAEIDLHLDFTSREVVPEPSAALLLGLGLAILGRNRRRDRAESA